MQIFVEYFGGDSHAIAFRPETTLANKPGIRGKHNPSSCTWFVPECPIDALTGSPIDQDYTAFLIDCWTQPVAEHADRFC